MHLRIIGSEKSFHVPSDLGNALLHISEGKLEEVPKEAARQKFNPKPSWTVVIHPLDSSQVAIKGCCANCKNIVSASGPNAHKTVFLTHCGVAQDRPPKHIIEQYENSRPKNTVAVAVEKVKKVFTL